MELQNIFRQKTTERAEPDHAIIDAWREEVAAVSGLTANPDADASAITTALVAVYRSGRRIEQSLGEFPDVLNREKEALTQTIERLWRQCKMAMIDLQILADIDHAKIMWTRMRTMCKIGSLLGCLDRLPGHETYSSEKALSQTDLTRMYEELLKTHGREREEEAA